MFKTMMSVTDVKMPLTEDIEKIPSFIFCKWLQNHPGTIAAANMINRYTDIPIFNQYLIIKSMLAGKKVFIKYPKKEKYSVSDDEVLAKHFKISMSLVKEYKQFMSESEISNILTDYSNMNSPKGNK